MSHAKQLHHRRYLNDYLEIINREGLPGNVKSDLCLQVQDTVIATVQHVIEEALAEELYAYLGLARYEHVPWGRPPESTRSGSYQRELITQYGRIADLRVPKLRRGNGALTWQSITRYEHCWGPMLDQHVMGYCLGHSLRDLQEAMALTLGEVLSLAACNRIVWRVSKQMEAFKQQPLASPPPIVLVDGMWVKIAYPTDEISEDSQGRRRAVKRKQKRVVLSALGVWPDGHWEIVHWQIAEGETADTWNAFFRALYLKGVTEQTTDLVVSDGSPGLRAPWIIISMGSHTNAASSIRSSNLPTIWCLVRLRGRRLRSRTPARARPNSSGKKPSWPMQVGCMAARVRPTYVHGPRCSETIGKPGNRRPWPTCCSILTRP